MLIKAKKLDGYKLNGIDGEIGKVKEFYFDDRHWTIRYLVADTGTWMEDRQVLISPYALVAINEQEKQISVNLTKKQIEDSPPLESDKPVSRQFEETYIGYYEWPMYWSGPNMWGVYPDLESMRPHIPTKETNKGKWDHHLRSTKDATGHHIQATDGEIGHVDDFIIDDSNWAIRYLVIDTRNWWSGKRVLVSPNWITNVSWEEAKVFINLSCEDIKKSPEYSEDFLVDRDYETILHRHYNRQGYWVNEPALKKCDCKDKKECR